MLSKTRLLKQCVPRHERFYSSTVAPLRTVPILKDASTTTFRQEAFEPATPCLLPRGSFSSIPAVKKWFCEPSEQVPHSTLNTAYLQQWGSAVVPLEITSNGQFAQVFQPLQFFLEYVISIPLYSDPCKTDP